MSDLKTKPTMESVASFIASVTDDEMRQDCERLVEIMAAVTGEDPKIWGSGLVGFGDYHYRYASGREGDWFITGFSPRKKALSIYIMAGFENYDELMDKLGKYKTGKSCLYVKRLREIDTDVLTQLVQKSVEYIREMYPTV